jgi:hypothetical protein
MKPSLILMLIVSSLLLQGQGFKKIEDSLFDSNFRLNSACDTSTLLLKEISHIPDSYEYLNVNQYCYDIVPASNSITYSFTFTSLDDNIIYINSGYSILSCTNVNFLYTGLYDNTTCEFVDEGYSFQVIAGHTYTWTLSASALGRFCQGFNTICPYWFIDTPLVIELLSFQGESYDGYINLCWITAAETSSNYFVIEKSSDAINFKEIDRIEASGNSSVIVTYKAVDNKPYEGNNYYRLVEYDFNGVRHEYTMICVYYPYKLNYEVYNIMGLPTDLNSPGFKLIKYENGNIIRKFIN